MVSAYICAMEVLPHHISDLLKNCKAANWAGAIFSMPGETKFSFFLQDLHLEKSSAHPQFYFYPFHRSNVPAIVLHPHYINEEAIRLLETQKETHGFWMLPGINELKPTSQKEYTDQFEKYIAHIKKGNCQKAILSTVVSHDLSSSFDAGEFLFSLRKNYPQAFIYVFSSPFAGTWIGATPEILISRNGTAISTMSLAGTRSKNGRFGNKEMDEQKIVSDYIGSVFHTHFDEVNISEPIELVYGDMVHLHTKISAETKKEFQNAQVVSFANDYHPTPAVGGFPKNEAVELILRTETHPRYYYSGFLGPVNHENASLFVNLRCMTLAENRAYAFAGGGITVDSEAGAEWEETRLKAQALLQFL